MICSKVQTIVQAGIWLARSLVDLTVGTSEPDWTLAKIPVSSGVVIGAGTVVLARLKCNTCGSSNVAVRTDGGRVGAGRWNKAARFL